MDQLIPNEIHCPYCDARQEVLLDPSVPEQEYVEDCQVCCQPILFRVSINEEGAADVSLRPENE
ncbi:CPXCG motif-containing cysteine-rich protein [Alkalilimnicola sp. S0819]|nr:CPXCG motif-containing cysteine-rich protein [Alkalilimnicola sp. S0819]MPQ16801.1 CPXCG motif-containing cysteine-rich protein [Alkalilimnicola sp. S0819]